jgi:hypothetical protein
MIESLDELMSWLIPEQGRTMSRPAAQDIRIRERAAEGHVVR